jgi:hypothetical protein
MPNDTIWATTITGVVGPGGMLSTGLTAWAVSASSPNIAQPALNIAGDDAHVLAGLEQQRHERGSDPLRLRP